MSTSSLQRFAVVTEGLQGSNSLAPPTSLTTQQYTLSPLLQTPPNPMSGSSEGQNAGYAILDTLDANPKRVTYASITSNPFFRRHTRQGRGTCCWQLRNDTGRLFIVKDAWTSREREEEWKLLEEVKDLVGVGQMVAYEDEGIHLSAFRDITGISDFSNRTLRRITFEVNGLPLEYFQSREQVLFAFRDALCGHRNLWNNEILHRDVTLKNIFLGLPGSEQGWRGVLIDLDMGIEFGRKKSLNGVGFKTGTRAFQSVNVLRTYLADIRTKPHDYLDDLESFYYSLCWICCGYEAPGTKVNPFPTALCNWEVSDHIRAAAHKGSALSRRFNMKVTNYFGPVFHTLLDKIHSFLLPTTFQLGMQTKEEALKPKPDLYGLVPKAAEDYATILGYVDTAIAELEEQTRKSNVHALPPVPPVPPHHADESLPGSRPSPRRSKRARVNQEDDSPSAKRAKRPSTLSRGGRN